MEIIFRKITDKMLLYCKEITANKTGWRTTIYLFNKTLQHPVSNAGEKV